jgi:hypothetical protein
LLVGITSALGVAVDDLSSDHKLSSSMTQQSDPVGYGSTITFWRESPFAPVSVRFGSRIR